MNTVMTSCAMLALLATAGAASADSITVEADGLGLFEMTSGNLAGLLANDPINFRSADMRAAHEALHADGISTDGLVTILFAETAKGLTLFTLVDDAAVPGVQGSADSLLGWTSTTSGGALLYINDALQDIDSHDLGPDGQTAHGTFQWVSQSRGDAIAWAALDVDDAFNFQFTDLGAQGLEGAQGGLFQFVSWTDDGWQAIAVGGFGEGGTFSFGSAVPLPGALALGIAGLALCRLATRRRN